MQFLARKLTRRSWAQPPSVVMVSSVRARAHLFRPYSTADRRSIHAQTISFSFGRDLRASAIRRIWKSNERETTRGNAVIKRDGRKRFIRTIILYVHNREVKSRIGEIFLFHQKWFLHCSFRSSLPHSLAHTVFLILFCCLLFSAIKWYVLPLIEAVFDHEWRIRSGDAGPGENKIAQDHFANITRNLFSVSHSSSLLWVRVEVVLKRTCYYTLNNLTQSFSINEWNVIINNRKCSESFFIVSYRDRKSIDWSFDRFDMSFVPKLKVYLFDYSVSHFFLKDDSLHSEHVTAIWFAWIEWYLWWR